MRAQTLILGLLLLSCKGKDDEPKTLTLATYNAGLAVIFVPGAVERAPMVADALAGVDADVVCLQEVWLPEHVAMVESAVAGTFDHTYFPAAQQQEMPSAACTVDDLSSLVSCMADDCGTVCDDELVDCLFDNCPLEFLTLPKDCNRCVQANVGTGDADIVNTNCTTGGQEYAYDGTFGTGLLSKYPMTVTETVLDSTTNRRGILQATVSAPGGDIEVFCTHLTAGLSAIPYPRETGSWESEQYDQAALLAGMAANAADPVVVLGDLNNGPTTSGGAVEEFPENYQLFLDAGLTSPYADEDGRCTFCKENNISSADSDDDQRVIDHVLVRGMTEVLEVGRLLDQNVDIQVCDATVAGNYSDHFGAYVTFALDAAEE